MSRGSSPPPPSSPVLVSKTTSQMQVSLTVSLSRAVTVTFCCGAELRRQDKCQGEHSQRGSFEVFMG